MSAASCAGAVQLSELPPGWKTDFAQSFDGIEQSRKRSSSLVGSKNLANLEGRLRQRSVDHLRARPATPARQGASSAEIDARMPLFGLIGGRRISLKAGSDGSDASPGKQKITDAAKARDRRISGRAAIVISSPPQVQPGQHVVPAGSRTGVTYAVGSPLRSVQSKTIGSAHTASSSDSDDHEVHQQRARAYAALTGARLASPVSDDSHFAPSPDLSMYDSATPSPYTSYFDATMSSPELALDNRSAWLPLSAASNVHFVPPSNSLVEGYPLANKTARRRTLSIKRDATRARVQSAAEASSAQTPPRSRVQSANAGSTAMTSVAVPRARQVYPTQLFSPAETSNVTPQARRKRRSLSQKNSLIATRLARAFIIRELGESSLLRRPATLPRDEWSSQDEQEQKELWLALHDGVLLCRLLNRILPDSIIAVDRRDTSSAKAANIAAFLATAKSHLPLQTNEYFELDHLLLGRPGGFDRVLHTVCAIAEYTTLISQANAHPMPRICSPDLTMSDSSPVSASHESRGSPLPMNMRLIDGFRSAESILLHSPQTPDVLSSSVPASFRPDERNSIPNHAITVREGSSDSSGSEGLSHYTTSEVASTVAKPQMIRSSSGTRIRLRTSSRLSGAMSKPAQGAEAGAVPRRSIMVRSTGSPSLVVPSVSRKPYLGGVYGNYPDKRMSESAVEIMSVVQEGEEIPRARRAVSDKPKASLPQDLDQSRLNDSVHFASPPFVIGSFEAGTEQERKDYFELPRQESQGDSALNAANLTSREAVPLRTTPKAKRRVTSMEPARRSMSASPTPSSPRIKEPIVPFPTSAVERSRTSVGYTSQYGDASAVNHGGEVSCPQPTNQEPSQSEPPSDLENIPALASPRRHHKRWNSDVHHATPLANRAEPQQRRSRHDSYMSPSQHDDEAFFANELRLSRKPNPSRRRSMDKAAAEASRQRIVVEEQGKRPVTYQLGECIGRGQFGSVYRALNVSTGGVVAIKRIKLAGKTEDEIVQLQQEVYLLKSLSHPSIVKYEGLVRTDQHINIVLEYVENGSLHRSLTMFGLMPETLIASYVLQILEGLDYLHSVRVIHRDLKAANILSTKTGNIKLSDFGVSLQLSAIQATIVNAEATGTPNWMAPEVIKLERVTYASDIWSLACVVVELLTGKPPYAEYLAMSALYKIVEDEMVLPRCSPELQDFLRRCFAKDPKARPSARQLFEHPWLQNYWQTSKKKQNLRPQDSIPFLRRVDLLGFSHGVGMSENDVSVAADGLPELARSISSPGEASVSYEDSLASVSDLSRPKYDRVQIATQEDSAMDSVGYLPLSETEALHTKKAMADAPMQRQASRSSTSDSARIPPRMHSFVKSSFHKPIGCKLCRDDIKKYAVICENCGVICHAKCKEFVPIPCDFKSNILQTPMSSPVAAVTASGRPQLAAQPISPHPAKKFGVSKPRLFRFSTSNANDDSQWAQAHRRVSTGNNTRGVLLSRSITDSPRHSGSGRLLRPLSMTSDGSHDAVSSPASSVEIPLPVNKPVTDTSDNVQNASRINRTSFSGSKLASAKPGKRAGESSSDCIVS